jgi:exonuclease I
MSENLNQAASAAANTRVDLAAGALPIPDLPPAFVFYDTETSGLSKAFDQILQIAAVRTDGDMNIVDDTTDSMTLRARRLPWIVPSPAAMIVTRLVPSDLEIQPLSSYALLEEVRRQFEAWSPAIFIGHNTIRFDEEMLRYGFFAALQDPYITQFNGNMRADTMIILHAVHLLAPGCMTIPMVAAKTSTSVDHAVDASAVPQTRPSFKLGDIARANGINFDEADAHDAMADVKATIEIAKLIRAKRPDIFRMMIANASKAHVLDQLKLPWQQHYRVGMTSAGEVADAASGGLDSFGMLASNGLSDVSDLTEPLLLGHVFGANAKLTPVLFIGTLPDNKNAAVVVDLTSDPDEWLTCDAAELSDWMEQNPRAFQKVKVNAFPILAPFSIAANHRSPVFIDLCARVIESGGGGLVADDVTDGDLAEPSSRDRLSTPAIGDSSTSPASGGKFATPATGAGLDQQGTDMIEKARTILAERMMRIVAGLTADPQARNRVVAAFAARQKVYPASAYLEENLYSGFPSTADRTLAHRMQGMSIPDRVRHIPALQDTRLREHAWRWVFAEDADALPPLERQRLSQWLHQRIRDSGGTEMKLPYMTTRTAIEALIEMHAAERDKLHSMTPAEQATVMARWHELLNYLSFIDRSAEELMEQQRVLIRVTNAITSGFDGIAPSEETIRSITGASKPSNLTGGHSPGSAPIDPDIGF